MTDIREFKDIIYLWPSAADFGRDIGVGEVSARAMSRRNSIPSKYWGATIKAAVERGISSLSYETLAKCATKKIINGHKPNSKRKRQ